MPCDVHTFLGGCSVRQDGFVATRDNPSWRLGGVMLVRSGGRMAVVRKAVAGGGRYEFTGMTSFPGGMVRRTHQDAPHGEDVERLLLASIRNRTLQETSLELPSDDHIRICQFGPVVTSYFAKGEQRYTAVVAAVCDVLAEQSLIAADPSVDAARWIDVASELGSFAPANCVVAAHLLWDDLSEAEKIEARPVIEAAVDRCGRWAQEIDLTPTVPPWADDRTLSSWRCGWPS